jgi:hypothetical protein
MADFLGVREDETIVYANNSDVLQTGSNGEEVARKLAEKAALFVKYTRKMGLSINAAKTQLLFLSRAGNVDDTTVDVDGSVIYPSGVIELLGVKYDRKLSTAPLVKALLTAAGISHLQTHKSPAQGGVPVAVVIRPGPRQILPCAGGCGTAKARA